jgi:hypothetical protein
MHRLPSCMTGIFLSHAARHGLWGPKRGRRALNCKALPELRRSASSTSALSGLVSVESNVVLALIVVYSEQTFGVEVPAPGGG